MKAFFIALSLAATLGSVAPASPVSAKAKPAAAVLVCPVTGEKIASIKDAAGHSTYKGKTYYFCCESCKPMFDKNPEKYVHTTASKK